MYVMHILLFEATHFGTKHPGISMLLLECMKKEAINTTPMLCFS